MATTTKKSTKTETISATETLIVLSPATQRHAKSLRSNRDLAKQAKEMSDQARQAILDAIGSITSNLIGTDAKGKRLLSIKLIPSSERLDLARLEQENPELYALLEPYKVAKGAGEPTIRVDVL
jgi:hypothetical protein